MDEANQSGGQDVQEMSEEQRAMQQLALGQSLVGGDDRVGALSALTEAAYLFIGLRDNQASEALSDLVNYIQGMGEQPFDTATQQMDEQHRMMLDQIVELLQHAEAGGGDEEEVSPQDLTPEVKAELLERAGKQLAEGREAATNKENNAALNSLVEAAAIYVALDDELKEDALAAFVNLLQVIDPNELNQLASQLDEQHQRWMMGIMSLLQQRTVQEHAPEIRAAAEQSLAAAQQAEQAADNPTALTRYAEAFSNAASLQDSELADTVLTSFAQMADNVGPGALVDASASLDERGRMAFQMLLSALAEMRDPTGR